jgi:APA family basic amino acid/polyamine antiporter
MVTAALKLAPMAAIVLLGLWVLARAPATYVRHLPPTPVTLPLTMGAATLTLFAMLGLECATIPGRRVRDPARTVPRATIVGVVVSAGIYIVVSTIPMLLLPQAVLARSSAPFVDLMRPYLGAGVGRWLALFVVISGLGALGAGVGRWLALFVVISGLGALNGWTLVTGELTRTMGQTRILPSMLGRTNRWGAPGAALVATGALASILVAMNYSRSLVEAFTFLINVVTAASLPLYLLCSASLAMLGRSGRPGWLVLGLAGVAYCVFVFVGVGWASFQWAMVLALAGLPFLALQKFGRLRRSTG